MALIKPKDLIERNIKMVSLPEIVAELNQMLNEPKTSAADIANKINQDPGLTVRLLKLVNSPFYNFPSKIDTVSMAITVLGTRQLRDLVVATVVIKRFQSNMGNFDLEIFWCHSLACAIAARVIGIQIKHAENEQIFIAGLLHDIGKMVIALTMQNEALKLMEAEKKSPAPETLEREIFGFTHSELGAELLRAWHFPEALIEPIACHHDYKKASQYSTEATIVYIANTIANNIQASVSRDDDMPLDPQALISIGLNQQEYEAIHEKVYAQLDDILQIMFYDIAA